MSSKAILTFADGKYREMQRLTLPRLREYARAHGYDLRVGDGHNPEGRPPSWSKVWMLRRCLVEYEACLWMDADVLVLDLSRDLADEVPAGAVQAVSIHPNPVAGEHPNCGVWYARRAALPFLKLVWQLEVFADHNWWEQAAVHTLLGYTGTDNCRPRHVRRTRWWKRTHFLGPEWNSHPLGMVPRPRFLHAAHAFPLPRRQEMVRAYL